MSDIVKKDVGRKRGRSAPRANPCAPPVEAPDHEYRLDWEARVSGQGIVLFLFYRPELLGLRQVAGHQRVEIILERADLVGRLFLGQGSEGVEGRARAVTRLTCATKAEAGTDDAD
jgi:hypothetical protein